MAAQPESLRHIYRIGIHKTFMLKHTCRPCGETNVNVEKAHKFLMFSTVSLALVNHYTPSDVGADASFTETSASSNTTFEIENVNVNLKFFFACFNFSIFYEQFYLLKILLNKIDHKPRLIVLNFSV